MSAHDIFFSGSGTVPNRYACKIGTSADPKAIDNHRNVQNRYVSFVIIDKLPQILAIT